MGRGAREHNNAAAAAAMRGDDIRARLRAPKGGSVADSHWLRVRQGWSSADYQLRVDQALGADRVKVLLPEDLGAKLTRELRADVRAELWEPTSNALRDALATLPGPVAVHLALDASGTVNTPSGGWENGLSRMSLRLAHAVSAAESDSVRTEVAAFGAGGGGPEIYLLKEPRVSDPDLLSVFTRVGGTIGPNHEGAWVGTQLLLADQDARSRLLLLAYDGAIADPALFARELDNARAHGITPIVLSLVAENAPSLNRQFGDAWVRADEATLGDLPQRLAMKITG